MTKVGFVFFDGLHIIHHFIGAAVELSKEPNIEVDILTYEGKHEYLISLLSLLNASPSILKKLPTYKYRKLIELLKSRIHPTKKYLFKRNRRRLLDYDILVFNDINCKYLYKVRKGNNPKFVLLMHGAGDRDYLIGKSFKDRVSIFDLITTPGEKINSFFKAMRLPNTKLETCGYQKFDITKIENRKASIFSNTKPTIIYNPHFQQGLSSWHEFGIKILDFFFENDNYNLIFAPHINLLNSKGNLDREIIDEKYFSKENILIDLGSIKSINMTYTLLADVYLGDVSSQIYEYLITPKPCIFINAHAVNWENNIHYKNWSLGKVLINIDNLEETLRTKDIWQNSYTEEQQKAISYTFDLSKDESSGKRAAEAIKKLC